MYCHAGSSPARAQCDSDVSFDGRVGLWVVCLGLVYKRAVELLCAFPIDTTHEMRRFVPSVIAGGVDFVIA